MFATQRFGTRPFGFNANVNAPIPPPPTPTIVTVTGNSIAAAFVEEWEGQRRPPKKKRLLPVPGKTLVFDVQTGTAGNAAPRLLLVNPPAPEAAPHVPPMATFAQDEQDLARIAELLLELN